MPQGHDDTAHDDPLRVVADGLRYALDAPPTRSGRKAVVCVALEGGEAAPLVDRCDLYAYRSRRALARLVAEVHGRDPDVILGHLALLLDQAERAAGQTAPQPERLTEERRRRAEALLAQPGLLDRAAQVVEQLGQVGEEAIVRLALLVAVSRLFARPLSALLLAPPGTGKSTLLDAVAALTPPEHVVTLARLSPQALYYAGPDALRHRLVIVDEFEGAADAAHAVRVLQTRGELRQTVTIRGRAEEVVARGPVAVMSGTTLTDLDPQNTSRCLELALDDSPGQTRRIQHAQARAWSGAAPPRPDLTIWHDAQRVLAEAAPAEVTIPFATALVADLPAGATTERRSAARLLGLVAAHALVHGRQRDRDDAGRVVATPADYAAVHALLRPTVAAAVDGLSPRAARVYRWLCDREGRGGPVTRRQVSTDLAQGYNTVKRALAELLAQELVAVATPGPPASYRLLDRTLLGGPGLLDPAALAGPAPSSPSLARRRTAARR